MTVALGHEVPLMICKAREQPVLWAWRREGDGHCGPRGARAAGPPGRSSK
jgi:hypothetical protein